MENKDVMLTAEEEKALLQPIDDHIGKIQEKINALRADGTDQIIALNNHIAVTRENANYTKEEKAAIIAEDRKKLAEAKAIGVSIRIFKTMSPYSIWMNTTIRSTITKSPSPARRRWPLKRRAIRLKLIS